MATLFQRSSVARVWGVRLADGREVVVKAMRPRWTSPARLAAVLSWQRHLADAGFPCPRPLAGPAVFEDAWAVAEELVDIGRIADAHDPGVRALMASSLARATRPAGDEAAALDEAPPVWVQYRSPALWPYPFQPDEAAAAIDGLAAKAKLALGAERPSARRVVSHADWETQNMRFAAGAVAVVYDWDSLFVDDEAVAVGLAAAVFTAQPDPKAGAAPTAEERWAFVTDYEAATGCAFARDERALVLAASAWMTAFNARLQHGMGVGGADTYRARVADLSAELG